MLQPLGGGALLRDLRPYLGVELLRQLASAATTEAAAELRRYQPLRFASAGTRAALAGGGLECPAIDRGLLAVYLSDWVAAAG